VGKAPPEGPDARVLAFPGDAYMSKSHALLMVEAEQILLTDPGSTNGTAVDGERCSKRILKGGEEVRMGETVFQVVRGS
jgi:pSer/pThr/pTyr-binding forkhead associated (FHA) protein